MAKSRRRRAREAETHKIITLGSSITCIILNLFVVCLHYFHPFVELLNDMVLIWCAMLPSFGIVGVLIFLTYVIHKGRQETMKRVFIALCVVLFLEIFVAFSTIITYVVVIDDKLSEYENISLFETSAVMIKIQKKLKCHVNSSRLIPDSSTKEQACIPTIRMQTRTIAVYVATIYMIKFVLLGSEALMILFYYMNYLPT